VRRSEALDISKNFVTSKNLLKDLGGDYKSSVTKPDMADVLDVDPESHMILNEMKAKQRELKNELEERKNLMEDVTDFA
jgi:hypothetical protein